MMPAAQSQNRRQPLPFGNPSSALWLFSRCARIVSDVSEGCCQHAPDPDDLTLDRMIRRYHGSQPADRAADGSNHRLANAQSKTIRRAG